MITKRQLATSISLLDGINGNYNYSLDHLIKDPKFWTVHTSLTDYTNIWEMEWNDLVDEIRNDIPSTYNIIAYCELNADDEFDNSGTITYILDKDDTLYFYMMNSYKQTIVKL